MKKTRKGFTIVELIIVIAVIAVLTAILVPTFIHLTKKANEAADHSLVTNLNKALAMREAEEGEKGKNKTMYDCVMDLEKEGYKLPQLATRSDEDLVWSLKENRFFLSSDYKEVDHGGKFNCWHIYEKMPETEEWAIYPNEDKWTETEVTVHKVGFDAGKAAVTKVTFDDEKNGVDAVIRTTGGTLNIANDGTKGKVRHYGSLDKANVTTDNNCFYTHGKIKNLDIAKGKAIASQDGVIFLTTAASGTTVAKESNGLVITISGGNIDENATVEESTNAEIGSVLFAGGDGTENKPFLIKDKDTFQHVSDLYYKGYYNYRVMNGINAIDCEDWTPVILNGNFDGIGTSLNNLDDALFDCANGESSTIKNFTINANIFGTGGVGAVVNDSDTLNLTIDSVQVHGTIINSSWVTPFVEFGPGPSYSWNLTIKNCLSDATLVATSGVASGFVGHPFDDVSNGSLSGGSIINIIDSAFIGNISATGSLTSTNFKYFTINGNNNRVTTKYSDEFIAKLGYNPEGVLYDNLKDNADYPVVLNDDGSKTFLCGNSGKNVKDIYKPSDKKVQLNTIAQTSLPGNIGDVFTITKFSNAVKATISLEIAPNDKNNYGSYLGTYMNETVDISTVATGSTFNSKDIRYFIININSGVTSATGVSGNIFNVVNPYYGKNAHNGANVRIIQSDANNNVLNITTVKIADPHAAE